MSEAADNLTAAVTAAAMQVDTVTQSLTAEIQQIADALTAGAGDPSLEAAAADAVSRLSTVASRLADINSTIQGIIP